MTRTDTGGALVPRVALIGAGPGDPGLITVRGLECLRAADVVIHDPRIPAALLAEAQATAEVINIGHASRPMAHEAISYLVAEKAREGKRVARVSFGDPFVFDRGGEEALFLHEQGVPFEVVPGIPAGLGVPAYAGVPVTYPGGGDTITLVRGYEDEDRGLPSLDWKGLSRVGGTVVCYAYGHQLPRLLEALIEGGWPEDGQVVVIYGGTQPNQETLSGTAAELLASLQQHVRRAPAILVAGLVVGFREHLRWFDTRPLFGKRVLVTRPRGQAAELSSLLASLGAQPVEAPMISIVPPEDPAPLRQAANAAVTFDWIVFSSTNAVDALMKALFETGCDVRALAGPRICAVGTATADRLVRYGVRADLIPEEFRSEGVAAAMFARGAMPGSRVLLPRADIGREVIAEELAALGAEVTEVVAYRTVLNDARRDEDPDVYGMLLEGRIQAVTFTSGSAVRSFVSIYGADQAIDLLRNTTVAVIGPVTGEAAAQLGIRVDVQPSTYTVAAMVDALAAHFAQRPAVEGGAA